MRIYMAIAILMMSASTTAFGLEEAKGSSDGKTMLPEIAGFSDYARRLFNTHPDLKSLDASLEAVKNVPARAYSLSNPEISFGLMNVPVGSYSLSDEGMTQKTVGVSQKFPAPGKRGLMKQIAKDDVEIQSALIPEKRLELIEKVSILFLELEYLQKARRVVKYNTSVMEGFVKVALAKYTVGAGLQQDVLHAQTEVSKMSAYLLELEERSGIVTANLLLLADLPEGTDLGRVKLPDYQIPSGGAEELEALAEGGRPLFSSLRSRIEKAERNVKLSRKDMLPDYMVSLTYGQRDDIPVTKDDLASGMLTLSVPLWSNSRQKRKIAEDYMRVEEAREMYNSEKQRLRIAIAELTAAESHKAKILAVYDEGLLQQASQTVDATLSAYQVNKVDFLTLVTNQVSLFNYGIKRDQINFQRKASIVRLMRVLGELPTEVANVE
ncbi:MAG: TolC family protein [Nitrospinota bacterium]|nr:TolC family protein [Nitrospinota bacterium]